MKIKILLVGDYNRSDFLFVAKQLHKQAKFYFIEYLNKKELKNEECLKYGDVLFWKDFSDAYDLLENINPDKVLFYFIESYNHVALNVAAKIMNVPTYHLEHGLRGSVSFSKNISGSVKRSPKKNILRLMKNNQPLVIWDKILNRRFFSNTIKESTGEARSFLKEYFEIRSKHSTLETWQKLQNSLRLPGSYISYSPSVFRFHKELDLLPDNYPVYFTGVPGFDNFFKWKNLENPNENVLFIDQPLHEVGLMGWTREYKLSFLEEIAHTITNHGKKLYIKPHPWNDSGIYDKIVKRKGVVIFTDQWEDVIPEINTVIGFSSTLLMPFMAMDQICCFTLELHPKTGDLPYSQFLLESGACHAVNNIKEFSIKLKERECWHQKQRYLKEQFISDLLYKFDGRSTERLKNILLGEVS